MINKREIIFEVTAARASIMEKLKPQFEINRVRDNERVEKEEITLDSCLRSFNREELLTGIDQ